MRILIDAANCTVGGGAAARHLLRALDNIEADLEVIALAPAGEAFQIRPRRLRLVQLPAESSSQWWKRRTCAGASRSGNRPGRHLSRANLPDSAEGCSRPRRNHQFHEQQSIYNAPGRLVCQDRIRFAALRRTYRPAWTARLMLWYTRRRRRLCWRNWFHGRKTGVGAPAGRRTPGEFPLRTAAAADSCILCPSSYLPHKNLERLIRAYDLCCRSVEAPPLIIAGFAPEPYRSRLDRYPAFSRFRRFDPTAR